MTHLTDDDAHFLAMGERMLDDLLALYEEAHGHPAPALPDGAETVGRWARGLGDRLRMDPDTGAVSIAPSVEDEFELWKAADEFHGAVEAVRQAAGTTMEIDDAVDRYVAARATIRALARYSLGLGERPTSGRAEAS